MYVYASGDAKERALGGGEQPWIAATEAGNFATWVRKRGDAALLLRPGKDKPTVLDSHAADPVIATGPGGRSPVVAAWESRDGTHHTIRCQRIEP